MQRGATGRFDVATLGGERVRAFDELHLPSSASLTRATVIKVGEIVGAIPGLGQFV